MSFGLTLHTELELLHIGDGAGGRSVRDLLAHAVVVPPLLGLAPQVGAAVHAGNVEDGDALQGRVAEIQDDPITLQRETERERQRGRQREREREKQRERNREIQGLCYRYDSNLTTVN